MCNILNVMSYNISCQIGFAVGITHLACTFVYFNCKCVNPVSLFFIILFHTVILFLLFLLYTIYIHAKNFLRDK